MAEPLLPPHYVDELGDQHRGQGHHHPLGRQQQEALRPLGSGQAPTRRLQVPSREGQADPREGKIPRHAKMYRNFQNEFNRLQIERENAFKEFYDDVQSGSFPESKHILNIDEKELDIFLNNLEKR